MTSAPEGLETILQHIASAHSSPDNDSLTESAIIASVSYLSSLPPEIHWLCNSSPLLPVVVQAIQLWGYGEPPAQATLAKFQPILAAALARCPECAVEWHGVFRLELKRVFTEVYSYDEKSTADFYLALEEWDGQRLGVGLENAIKIVERIPMAWKHIEVKGPLVECLAAPNLLLWEEVYIRWKELFLRLERMPVGVGDRWLPGAAVFVFDSDARVKEFGEQMFRKRSHKLRESEFDSGLRDAIVGIALRAAHNVNGGDFSAATTLWNGVNFILRNSEPSLILSSFTSSPLDILKLLISHLSTSGPHFPAMLNTVSQFFQSISKEIWQRTTTTASNLVDLILSNPSFETILLNPDSLPLDTDLSVLLDWLPAFMSTQSDHAKVQIASKVLFFLFETFNHTRFPELSKIFCLGEGMRLLRGILEDCIVDNEFVDQDVALALKLDVVQMVDKYSSIITRTAKTGDARATRVLGLRLSLDCRLLEDEMKEVIKSDVFRGHVIPTIKLTEMWKLVEQRSWNEDDTNLIRATLAGVGRAATLDLLDSHNFETKDVERVKRFSKATLDLQRFLVSLFSKMSDIRPRIMRSILEDNETCTSVVCHLFNAKRQNLENADLDMLKTTYDVTGKQDLWRTLLRTSFEPALNGVCQVTQQILSIQRLSPSEKLQTWHRGYLLANVGKIIRQSMQIVDILCSGRSGILTTTDILFQSDSNTSALQRFWRTFWEILNVAFISATSWAEKEDKDTMKNFLRDVLEGGSVLFDSLKCIDACLSGQRLSASSPVKASNIQHSLLKDVQIPLQNLSKWLALSVEDLRETTVTLATKMLKRFARAELQVREDTLVQYYRLAHGKKKNNMSEEQRERLLVALSEHDVEPSTRKAVEAMAASKAAARVPTTPELAKDGNREVIDITGDEYMKNYISDSDLNDFMDQLEQTPKSKPSVLKQTKLDFSKATLKPPASTTMSRTNSAPGKSTYSTSKSQVPSTHTLSQLKADFKAERIKPLGTTKIHRAPVAAPATDAFGRPLDAAGRLVDTSPRLPPSKKVEESSSESSSEDSDDETGGLFSIAKENKSPPKVRKIEKRRVQLLGEPVRSRIALQARDREFGRVPSERNLRARLEPDTTTLLKQVLAWTPNHSGSFPPGTKKEDFQRVTGTFSSSAKYQEIFEPLLMLECWQHILAAKTESLGETFDFVIENRQKIDEFVELFVTMKHTVYANVGLLDPDLVIISNSKGKAGKECFAKVQGMKKKKDSVELSLRCLPAGEMAGLLVPKATMHGVKLFSLTPILREYGALKGLPYYDLVEEILAARPSMPVNSSQQELKFTMDAYAVNEPQAAAIVGACQNEGFSLIQGPPGTGKTKTILGMVGAFLTGNAKPGSTSIAIPGQQPSYPPPKPRLLLCAPSNAAVDEIVLRLIGGIRNAQGQRYQPNIVRVGRSDNINTHVRGVTLDELVDKKLESSAPKSTGKGFTDDQTLRAELNKILELRNTKGVEYDRAREIGDKDMANLAGQLRDLNAQKNRIGAQLDDQKEKRLAMIRDADVNRRQIIAAILDEADVICCTLSGSGHDQLAKMKVNFETVIIDEAAQSIELAALIPLKYGCQRCVLVGDPNQLPPTVLSQAAANFQYEESLFVRMQRNHPKSVYLLSIQYRMNPEISRFPSEQFYEGKLIDGPNMAVVTDREWHQSALFRPYCFFNVHGGAQERGKKGVSLMNRAEVNIAISIYDRLRADYDHIDFGGKIGIVTPYKEQLRELLRQFRSRYGPEITNSVDFNTIDGFQGQEKDIIILSCVRAAEGQGVGFLKDVRRINVALTRAKSTLFILGNKDALKGNEFWKSLIDDAERRRILVDCGPQTFAMNAVPPQIRASRQSTTPSQKKILPVKARKIQSMGELIPLGTKAAVGSKNAPVMIESDVEMKDGDISSEDEPSLEDGEIKDVEMPDAVPDPPSAKSRKSHHDRTPTLPAAKPAHKPPTPPQEQKSSTEETVLKKKVKKHKQLEQKDSVKSPSKIKKVAPSTKPSQPTVEATKSTVKPPKRPPPSESSSAPVYKRKPTAANLFITNKKPAPTNVGNGNPPAGEKKESVKQRLARQMRPQE